MIRRILILLILCTATAAFGQNKAIQDTNTISATDSALAISQEDNILDTATDKAQSDSALTAASTSQIQMTKKEYGTKRIRKSKTGRFFIGLGAFLLFGILRYLYSRHISELVGILSRSTLGRMTSKEAIWQNLMPRWLFLLIYFLAGGHIIGLLIAHFGTISESPLVFWFWGIAIIFIGFLFKFLAVHSVGLVFRFNKTASSFFNHLSVVNQLVGLILLPISGILMLAPPKLASFILAIAAILLFTSMIFKWLINIGYVRNLPRVSYLHFILYLCTLEFIPLAVCTRYVYDGIGA